LDAQASLFAHSLDVLVEGRLLCPETREEVDLEVEVASRGSWPIEAGAAGRR
jgi:hypothetical protein